MDSKVAQTKAVVNNPLPADYNDCPQKASISWMKC